MFVVMWRKFFESYGLPCFFGKPVSAEVITDMEQSLSVVLPPGLRELFREMNGVAIRPAYFDNIGEEDAVLQVIWTLDQVLQENKEFRTIASLEHLLFFAREPNGDPIGYSIAEGKVINSQLIVMSHEDYEDRRVQCASLQEYLTILMEAS